jgi:HD-GYP domain-containing protein (c-di-GMP phosphodiesterase class II)
MQANLDKLVIQLSRGIGQRKLYHADHPRVRDHGRLFVTQLQAFLAEIAQDAVFVGVVDGKLVYNGRFLVGPSIAGGHLVEFARLLQCGGLRFHLRTTEEEVRTLLGLVTELKEPVGSLAEGRALLAARGVVNIHIAGAYNEAGGLAAADDAVSWQGRDQGGHSLGSPLLIYQALYEVVTNAHGNAALDRTLDIDGTRSVSEYLLHSTRANFTDIMHLMNYPDYDSYTVGHSVRVAALAVYTGDRHGLKEEELLDLGAAGLLHDVGKSKIPDEILFKPGRLDPEEFKIMQSHPAVGAEILMEHKTVTPLDIAGAWGHHIRHDGGGYPQNPPWAVRNRLTALLQVCDVFEALTAIRPYKAPMTPRVAFEIMLKDKGAFNPTILHAFISGIGLYPPGNIVRLTDGTFATVVAAGADIERPQVQITHQASGQALADGDRQFVDLAAADGAGLGVAELLLDPESVLT